MEKYIGVKIVKGEPMNLGDYYEFKNWVVPEDKDPESEGYLVIYEDGYVSWSPAEAFKAYRPCSGMTLGLAIEAMNMGYKVSRKGWNGEGMFIVYMPPMFLPAYSTADTNRKVNDRTAKWIGEDTPLDCQGYFAMFTAAKKWQPGWLPSQADMLAEDWQILS